MRNGGCNSFVGLESFDRVLLGVNAGHGTRPTFAASSCGHVGWLRQHAHLDKSECYQVLQYGTRNVNQQYVFIPIQNASVFSWPPLCAEAGGW